MYALQGNGTLTQQLPGVLFCAIWMFGFGIADNFGSVNADNDVLSAYGYLEVKPFSIFCEAWPESLLG